MCVYLIRNFVYLYLRFNLCLMVFFGLWFVKFDLNWKVREMMDYGWEEGCVSGMGRWVVYKCVFVVVKGCFLLWGWNLFCWIVVFNFFVCFL